MAVDAVDEIGCKKCFRLQQRESLNKMTFDCDKDVKYCRVKCLSTSVLKLALHFQCVLALTEIVTDLWGSRLSSRWLFCQRAYSYVLSTDFRITGTYCYLPPCLFLLATKGGHSRLPSLTLTLTATLT